MKQKIIIMGGGVGGLSCAHSFIPFLNKYDVVLIERNSTFGGQARTKILDNGIHSEYCWHVIGNNYHNLWRILKEIPFGNNTVADNLKPINTYIYGRYSNVSTKVLEERGNSFLCSGSFIEYAKALYKMGTLDKISFYDFFKLLEIYYITNSYSLEELKFYDNILWKDYTKNMSIEAKKWIADSPAIYLGMDIDKLSAHTMFHLLRPIIQNTEKEYDFYSFNGPFNEKWFEPWVEHLHKSGVNIINANIQDIGIKGDQIEYIIVHNEKIFADYFINALSVESLASLIPEYKLLEHTSRQIQTQVLYYIDKKLMTYGPTILILPDTLWCIMVRVEGNLWNDINTFSKSTEYEFSDILSAGIGIWSRKGLSGKTALESTIDEIKKEVWAQIVKSQTLVNYIQNFKYANVVYADVWDSFYYDEFKGEINTWEPKFSNNVGTLSLRPSTHDHTFKNLRHSTAYTLTNANIFNMESACEAGCRAAKSIEPKVALFDKRDNPSLIFEFVQKF